MCFANELTNVLVWTKKINRRKEKGEHAAREEFP
jgi:hypothetical protein